MAARFALVPFVFRNTVTTRDELILPGAQRDSVTDQAFLQSPASFWSTNPPVVGVSTSPQLAAYMAAYPTT
jgi:hypothetical protein